MSNWVLYLINHSQLRSASYRLTNFDVLFVLIIKKHTFLNFRLSNEHTNWNKKGNSKNWLNFPYQCHKRAIEKNIKEGYLSFTTTKFYELVIVILVFFVWFLSFFIGLLEISSLLNKTIVKAKYSRRLCIIWTTFLQFPPEFKAFKAFYGYQKM